MDYMSKPTKKDLRNQARVVKAALVTLEAAHPDIDFSGLHTELLRADFLAGDFLFSNNTTPLSDHAFPGEITPKSGGGNKSRPN